MKVKRKIILLFLVFVLKTSTSFAQIDTAFWFAAPWVTPDHWWKDNVVIHLSTFSSTNTVVRLRQPGMTSNKYDTIINISANSTFNYVFWRNKLANSTSLGFDLFESRPANTVLPYGLYISSSEPITAVYDVVTRSPSFLNTETFSLKGQNGLGTEFVCPGQTLYRNKTLTNNSCPINPSDAAMDVNCDGILTQPKQQINIVSSQPNTIVWITPRANIVGHIANVTYSIMLPVPGSVYTLENLVQNTYLSGNNLSGSIIVSDKPISVTVADDSVHSNFSSPAEPGYTAWSGVGCFDLIGDQIVPVDVLGKDYIINRGQLYKAGTLCTPCNGTNASVPNPNHPGMKESAFIVATENFTQLQIFSGGLPTVAYLNKGDTYIDTLTSPLTYVHADKNVYVYHMSGLGCELGAAILPPLTCAGSKLIAFSRNQANKFALNILCKNGSQNTFTLNGSTSLVPGTAFAIVPGTGSLPGGPFWGAQISLYSTSTLPIGSYTIGNNTDEFALGVFDGDFGTGGLFHYMSSFLRKTVVKTQTLTPICSGSAGTVALTGTITGADIAGYWSTSYTSGTVVISGGASGAIPSTTAYASSVNTISTVYTVSVNDTTSTAPTKTITLYLSSIGSCKSVTDSVKLVINQRPKVFVSGSTIMCKNNVLPVVLSGTVVNAVSGQWGGGNGGIFGAPGLVTTYTPSQADLAANTITLNLTSQAPLTGCPNSVKSLTVGFINPPVVNITPNTALVCTNSTTLALNGSVTGLPGTGGIWLGGTGAYTLTNTSPTATYILSPNDLNQSGITLTLSSTNNGICASESATMQITVLAKPVLGLPPNFTVCAGSVSLALSGTITVNATQGVWSSSMSHGAFSNQQAQQSPVNTTYSLSSLDTNYIYFVLESAPGICPVEKDSMMVSILAAPIVKVNDSFTPVCKNAAIALTGTVSGYTSTGIWSTSSNTSSPGTFTPGANFLYASYLPSATDIANGFVILTLMSTNNFGQCPASYAAFTASFVPSPTARFTFSPKRCLNAPLLFNDASLTNGTAFLKWNWDFGDNNLTGGSSQPNPIKTYTVAQQYVVTLTVTGVSLLNVECPDVFDTVIRIKPLPIADFKVSPACQGFPVIFTNQSIAPPGSDPIIAWKWEFGDSIVFNVPPLFTGVPTSTVAHAYGTPERFSAFLTVTATAAGSSPSLGCVSDPHREYIDVFSKPKAEFGLTNNPSVVQEPVYFSDFTTPSGNIAQWFWEFGDEGASDEQAPVHTYQKAGIFSIKLTVTDFAGCKDTLRKEIDVTLLPQLPGGFTPNGDGTNDLLFVKGGPFEKMIFRVYNNWGEVVFETADQKVGWDGKKNGIDQPVGVYVWTLVADMYNNRQVKKNGDITLIR